MAVSLREGTPTLQATISGYNRVFILDTGSSISLMHPEVYSSNVSPYGVTGNELEIKGMQEVKFRLKDREFHYQFCVCSLPTDADGILGMGFLSKRNAELNLEKLELRILKCPKFKHDSVNQRRRLVRGKDDRRALTVFVTQNGQRRRERRIAETRRGEGTRKQEGKQHPRKIKLQESEPWIVKATGMVRLAPRVKQIVVGKMDMPKRRASPELVCVEPAQHPLNWNGTGPL